MIWMKYDDRNIRDAQLVRKHECGMLRYELYKRKNTDSELDALFLYDLRMVSYSPSAPVREACICAVSSVCERANKIFDMAVAWEVTPVAIEDFYSEYLSR